jgi:MtN3 and saliva related transmembrane protein
LFQGWTIMIEGIGYVAAFLTTACYLPQAMHVIRSRQTAGISLMANVMLVVGIVLWLIYGISHRTWPLVACNGVLLALVVVIVAMRVRLGSGRP